MGTDDLVEPQGTSKGDPHPALGNAACARGDRSFIGGIEALGLIADKLGLKGGFWRFVNGLNDDLANFGFAIVGVFVASWVTSTIIYRAKGYDDLPAGQS